MPASSRPLELITILEDHNWCTPFYIYIKHIKEILKPLSTLDWTG